MLKKNKRVCNVIDNSVIFFFLSDNLVSNVYIMYVCMYVQTLLVV